MERRTRLPVRSPCKGKVAMNAGEYIGGCEASPGPYGCLKCPLPLCRHDDPQGFINWQRRERRAQILALTQDRTVVQVAERLGIHERTIYRRKAAAKEAIDG
mgnify:CR=1 FL=1